MQIPLKDQTRTGDGNIIVAVRPERIRVYRDNTSSPPLTVDNITYLGSTVRYKLALKDDGGNGQDIYVELSAANADYEVGEMVWIGLDIEDLHFFP